MLRCRSAQPARCHALSVPGSPADATQFPVAGSRLCPPARSV